MGQWSRGYNVALTTRRSPVQFRPGPLLRITPNSIEEFLTIIELSGVTTKHKKEVERALNNYAKYILFRIDKQKSLSYFKLILEEYSIKYYKKQMHSIKKFLLHLGIDWANEIVLPKDPINNIKRIDTRDIIHAINSFNNSKHPLQLKALILLGTTSGLRAEELYQLQPSDIDLENRIVIVNHNPKKGQSTKTGKSRISFFNSEAQQIISEYLNYFKDTNRLKQLFSQTHITHLFRGSPIKVKDLRKYFSQNWDRRGGPTSIKKILMGHSLKGDVDLQHYNAQSEEDLKRIYDKVMNSN
jgi:integrase/recombinase XerD